MFCDDPVRHPAESGQRYLQRRLCPHQILLPQEQSQGGAPGSYNNHFCIKFFILKTIFLFKTIFFLKICVSTSAFNQHLFGFFTEFYFIIKPFKTELASQCSVQLILTYNVVNLLTSTPVTKKLFKNLT